MSRAIFEDLIKKEIAELAEAMFKLNAGDATGHAVLKGRRLGIERASELYRESVRVENPEDKL